MNAVATIVGWAKTAVSAIMPPPAVVPGDLASLVLSESRDFGPSPTTGGVLHKIDRATAEQIATLIERVAPAYQLDPLLVIAGLVGESRCDPMAYNPNHQDRKAGESAHDAFLHTDLGMGQFDGRELAADPTLHGKTDDEIRALAENPSWAIPRFCALVRNLLDTAEREVATVPELLKNIPNRDPRILGLQGYNSGITGARLLALGMKPGGCAYGIAWITRLNRYLGLMSTTES